MFRRRQHNREVAAGRPARSSVLQRLSRPPVFANLLIAAAGFLLLARLAHFPLTLFDSRQTFMLGFSLGMMTAGSLWLHLGRRTAVGFFLGAAGIAAFAAALFWL